MRVLTAAEKASVVVGYLAQPHGSKAVWLAQQGVRYESLRRWWRMYLFGDLERGLLPRDTARVGSAEVTRIQQLEAQLAAERQEHAALSARLAAEVERLQGINDVLGKAIGLLHDRSVRPEPTVQT